MSNAEQIEKYKKEKCKNCKNKNSKEDLCKITKTIEGTVKCASYE